MRRCYCQRLHYSAVLFATGDGGRTWKPDRMLFSNPVGMPFPSQECTLISAVIGPAWIVANYSRNTSTIPPSLTTLFSGAKTDFSNGRNTFFWQQINDSDLLRLDFVTPSVGWIGWHGQLLSTTNGGGTWTPITPKLNQPATGP